MWFLLEYSAIVVWLAATCALRVVRFFDCVPSCDRALSVYSLLPSVRPGVFRDTGVSDVSFESIPVSLADSAFGVLVCDLF